MSTDVVGFLTSYFPERVKRGGAFCGAIFSRLH